MAGLGPLRSGLIALPSLCITGASLSGQAMDVLIEFSAREVQNGMIDGNASLPPERRIEFRICIHVGDE